MDPNLTICSTQSMMSFWFTGHGPLGPPGPRLSSRPSWSTVLTADLSAFPVIQDVGRPIQYSPCPAVAPISCRVGFRSKTSSIGRDEGTEQGQRGLRGDDSAGEGSAGEEPEHLIGYESGDGIGVRSRTVTHNKGQGYHGHLERGWSRS